MDVGEGSKRIHSPALCPGDNDATTHFLVNQNLWNKHVTGNPTAYDTCSLARVFIDFEWSQASVFRSSQKVIRACLIFLGVVRATSGSCIPSTSFQMAPAFIPQDDLVPKKPLVAVGKYP
ncbi:hypothetical protein Tco_0596926 [Tanacetum coccineum]